MSLELRHDENLEGMSRRAFRATFLETGLAEIVAARIAVPDALLVVTAPRGATAVATIACLIERVLCGEFVERQVFEAVSGFALERGRAGGGYGARLEFAWNGGERALGAEIKVLLWAVEDRLEVVGDSATAAIAVAAVLVSHATLQVADEHARHGVARVALQGRAVEDRFEEAAALGTSTAVVWTTLTIAGPAWTTVIRGEANTAVEAAGSIWPVSFVNLSPCRVLQVQRHFVRFV